MSLSIIPFVPLAASPPFSSTVTLDGNQYILSTRWNVFGARWYIYLSDLSGNLIVTKALVGSPDAVPIQSLSWAFDMVTAKTSVAHGFSVGAIVPVYIFGNAPGAYNGLFDALIIDDETLTYPVAGDPGQATSLGSAVYLVDMVESYFQTSFLAYSESARQFLVGP